MAVGEAIPTIREQPIEEPVKGDILFYFLPEGRNKGESRPGIVTEVIDSLTVNMQVFVDNVNDGYGINQSCIWATSVKFSKEGGIPGTWHWLD